METRTLHIIDQGAVIQKGGSAMSFSEHIKKITFFKSNPEWVWYDENELPHLTDKAPPEAVESYNYWKKWYEKSKRDGIIYD